MYKEILVDLKFGARRFIKYQVGTKLLIFIVILPFLKVVFNGLMRSRGFTYLTNGLLTKFLLSPQGVMSVLFGAIIATSVIVIEIGGLITLSHQVINKEAESSYYTIFKYCMKKMKHLMGFDGLIIVLYLMIISPWLQIGMQTSLLQDIRIPGFIKDVIYNDVRYTAALTIVAMALFIVAIRWIFTIHNIMLKDQKGVKALKESSKLVKNNLKAFIKNILGIGLINFSILGIISIFYILIAIVSVAVLGETYGEFVMMGLFGIGIFLLGIGQSVLLSFQILHTTKLFYLFNDGKIPLIRLEEKGKKLSLFDQILNHKKVMIGLWIGMFLLASVITKSMIEYIENTRYEVKVTAHRGSSKNAPGNTLAAIDVAIKHGADYAEIDVQETKDGKIVLLHDKSLERTTGVDKNIWEVTLDEIKTLDAGSWFDEKYKGEKIATLEEVIDYTKGKIKLNIEIKTNGHEKNLIPQVIELIKKKDILNTCVVTSLDYDAIQQVEAIESKVKTGYIMFVAMGNVEDLNVDFYSVEQTNATDEFITAAHKIGREVHVWTINEEEDMDEMIELGVDNIITDFDQVLKQKLSK
ncbi:MAG: glycerophosphodiester phosphodiesterase [Marinisporobacter sp.]|jgi:glycerophosphoryl diester phosphodiesterase|nr:glycerophosphodiester phosphodiesterase [Marinisporobacter sp.]